MFTLRGENNDFPILAVDLGSTTMRGLLCPGGASPSESCRFLLPSPEWILAGRIRSATKQRRAIHLHGVCMGLAPVAPLTEHLDAGLGLSMHPGTAAAFSHDPSRLEDRGVSFTAMAPPGSVSLHVHDFDPTFWKTLCATEGLPQPERILVCATEYGHPFDYRGRAARSDLLCALFALEETEGLPLDKLLPAQPGPPLWRLSAIQRITGHAVADTAAAFLLGLLSIPDVFGRSFRQGIVLAYAGQSHVAAALVFAGRLFGFFELPLERAIPGASGTGRPEMALLLRLLEDFRLGWLPQETVAELGGHQCRMPRLPAEAEGFVPLYVTGPGSRLFAGQARLVGDIADNCQGLLSGSGKTPG
jgi:uncharacterized protein (DUF1786 family)